MRARWRQPSLYPEEGRGSRNIHALVRYTLFLCSAIFVFTVLFQVLMSLEGQKHSWITAIYWVLTVMSTLGLGDITFAGDAGRLFTSLVLLSGVVLLIVGLPFVFISFFFAPFLGAHVRLEAPHRLSSRTQGHVIIVAFEPVAAAFVRKLRLYEIPYCVLEPDRTRAAELVDQGYAVVHGRPDHAETFRAVNVNAARMVLANAGDALNANIVLTIREVSERVPVVAIGSDPNAEEVLTLAGCDHVLSLKQRLGEQLANRVSAQHAEAHPIGNLLELLMAEFPVQGTPLSGKRVRDLALREMLGINIVALWERGRLKPVHPDILIHPRNVLVVLGAESQLKALNTFLIIYDTNYSPVVVVGGGVVGCATARALRARAIPVHLIEREQEQCDRLLSSADRVIMGDASDHAVVEASGLLEAPSVVITTNDDDINIYLTLYYRRLSPQLRIISRITHEENREAICRAGADFVLSFANLGADALFSWLLRRDLVVLGEGMELHEIPVPPSLEGSTLADSGIAAKTGLNVVGVKLAGGESFPNPPPGFRLLPRATLIMLGTIDQLESFRQTFQHPSLFSRLWPRRR